MANPNAAGPTGPGFTLGDFYFVFFRHKWKIAIISGIGVIAAAAVWFTTPKMYESEAEILIRFVVDKSARVGLPGMDRIMNPDARGENIIGTELEILHSLDLAKVVAEKIGPTNVLAKAGGGTNLDEASLLIQRNLVAEAPKKGSVIHIAFQHRDPAIAKQIVGEAVAAYRAKHAEVHGAAEGSNEFLTRETEQLKNRLKQLETDLSAARRKAGLLSIDDDRKAIAESLAKTEQEKWMAEAELAANVASVEQLKKQLPSNLVSAIPSFSFSKTNHGAASESSTNQTVAVVSTNQTPSTTVTNETQASTVAAVEPSVPAAKTAEYTSFKTQLENLRKMEQDMAVRYASSYQPLVNTRSRIEELEKNKLALEKEFPSLAVQRAPSLTPSDPARSNEGPDLAYVSQMKKLDTLNAAFNQIVTLQAKLSILTNRLEQIRRKASEIDDMEGDISELKRAKELTEKTYIQYALKLQDARAEANIGSDQISNMEVIQEPSIPLRSASKLMKKVAGILLGGIAAAFGLAFGLEFFLDRSIKRPDQVEPQLGLPLFLSLPALNGHLKALSAPEPRLLTSGEKNGESPGEAKIEIAAPATGGSIPPWSPNHPLKEFYEVLRDRLIADFEARNLTHKPKLVAVTSCAEGAGVSTVAAGLAASLSETGDGNVLLVDMNLEHGAAHHFYQGKLDCDLDDALEMSKREQALVQENLYVVAESTNGDKLPRFLPKRFSNLVPKLKASDYDYIIFDMPPVSQISVTPRLARFMDMIFLVVESEKTDREVVKQGAAMLSQCDTKVGVILNQARSYVPRLLQQEL